MEDFLQRLYNILTRFLGESKSGFNGGFQYQFPCPRCIEDKGEKEKRKYNLEVNLKGVFNCWSCSSIHDEMHGSIVKLIRQYGSESLLNEYCKEVNEFKKSKLYELHFKGDDFNIQTDFLYDTSLQLPKNYCKIERNSYVPKRVRDYLFSRGLNFDIIENFNIGYTKYDENDKLLSSRIVLPSYDEYGQLNYWTGRDFTEIKSRQKYCNQKVERKNLIFNENKIQWDADIVLVEGPFDHIVVPNSIPLLGKSLKTDFAIYNNVMAKANANVIVWLDGDALNDVKKIYKLLNQGRLKGKIKYVPTETDLDPSDINKLYGKSGIIEHLMNATHFSEIEMLYT